MSQGLEKAFVVYCSPSGSTRHVAQGIEAALGGANVDVRIVDLGHEKEWASIFDEMTATKNRACLFIGSPVYAGHPIPPVMQFIGRMPTAAGLHAAPFVTWGQVISGLALYDMAAALCEKSVKVIGAMKILAQHSMMWDSEDPLGKGHPNAGDNRMISEFVKKIESKMAEPDASEIRLSALRYYPDAVCEEIAGRTMDVVKPYMPERQLNTERCTQCGTCAEVCPTDAIAYTPFPEFTDDCIFCYVCVQNCPESALTTEKAFLDGYLRDRSTDVNEQPYSKYFV